MNVQGVKGTRGGYSNVVDFAKVEAKVGKISVSSRYHVPPANVGGDYELSNTVLGSGFNGPVRLAKSKRSNAAGEKFAVKDFNLISLEDDDRLNLKREVEVFLSMDHPHVTRLHDVYESKEHLHMIMECMEGGDLFDRLSKKKRFSELDAADVAHQMLLALNYLHSHGICHRDVKLENFLYDKEDSSHLKLIDFGFSKFFDPSAKMRASVGTSAYAAPEVLAMCYTQQCDLWSFGVVIFILLVGYMPFSGSATKQEKDIAEGKFKVKPEKWSSVSADGIDFVRKLLVVDPIQRLTTQSALEHSWIARRERIRTRPPAQVDESIVNALRSFARASKLRRCCLEMMAWSLTNDEHSQVRAYFIAMDMNQQGTILLDELRQVMVDKFQIADDETRKIFEALDSNSDEEIHYSDFLAAMVSTRITLHDNLLRAAFEKFDVDSSGYITVENLRDVIGDTVEGEAVDSLIQEADLLQDGRISYAEFVAYLRGQSLESVEKHGEGSEAAKSVVGNATHGCFEVDRVKRDRSVDAICMPAASAKLHAPYFSASVHEAYDALEGDHLGEESVELGEPNRQVSCDSFDFII